MFSYGLFLRIVGFFLLLSLYLPWYPSRLSLNMFTNDLPNNVPAAALGNFANNRLSDINCSSKAILSQDPMTLAPICVPFYVLYSPMQILGNIDFANIFGIGKTEGWISYVMSYSSSDSSNRVSQLLGLLEQFTVLADVQISLPSGEHLLLIGWGLLFFLATTMVTFKWGLKLAVPVAGVFAWLESGKLPLQMGVGFYGVMVTLAVGLLVDCGLVGCFIATLKALRGFLGVSKAADKKKR